MCCIVNPAASQSFGREGSNLFARFAFKRALEAYEAQSVETALVHLDKALSRAPRYVNALILKGEILYGLSRYDESAPVYASLAGLLEYRYPAAYYYLGMSLLKTGDYRSARDHLDRFMAHKGAGHLLEVRAEKALETCDFALNAMAQPVPFEPVNLGPAINSPDAEYSPSVTADGQTLVFTRRSARSQAMPQEFGTEVENFYVSYLLNGSWTRAVSLGSPINTQGNEGAQSLSVDGQELYFTACNRADGFGSCDIYYARRQADEWSRPRNLGPVVNGSSWDSHPSISADGKRLFFASNRSGSKGDIDIWLSEKDGQGQWQTPRNLNPQINTTGRELSPFIHPDGQTLYFSSDGHAGMGGLDLFYSRLDETGQWSKPLNLGYPINTFADEFSLVLDASGTTAYYASDKEGGHGQMDIYTFELYEQARPAPMTYMKGRVLDADTGAPMAATIELIDLATDHTLFTVYPDPVNGEFLMVVPMHLMMALNVAAPGYLFHSDHFDLTQVRTLTDPYVKDILLQPIRTGESVILKNVFFDTGSYRLDPASLSELQRLAGLLMQNTEIHIEVSGHTDHVGQFEDNMKLSENRAESVVRFLTELGVNPGRMSFKGYADTKPVDTNDTEAGRANNRRTEFKIVTP